MYIRAVGVSSAIVISGSPSIFGDENWSNRSNIMFSLSGESCRIGVIL